MSEYRYEMHMHSAEVSRCARSPVTDMVRAYKKAGYAGAVLTDHFIFGHTAVPKDIPWEERMALYYKAYLDGLQVARELDFDFLFGLEHAFSNAKEILIYGVEPELLTAHPEIEQLPVESLCRLLQENGCFLSLAHPYRVRDYIPVPGLTVAPDLTDAIEVYNAWNYPEENDQALELAEKHHRRMTSGGDVHYSLDDHIGMAGMVFPRRIRTNAELVKALRADEGHILWDGKEMPQ